MTQYEGNGTDPTSSRRPRGRWRPSTASSKASVIIASVPNFFSSEPLDAESDAYLADPEDGYG